MRYTRGMISIWSMLNTEEHVTVLRDHKYDKHGATGT
jgi:hypothetical protein